MQSTHAADIAFNAILGAQNFVSDDNWVGGFAPTNLDRALINTTVTLADYAFLDQPFEVQNITLGSTVGQAGTLEVQNNGALTSGRGCLRAARVASIGLAGTGTVRILSGSSLTMTIGALRLGDTAGSIGKCFAATWQCCNLGWISLIGQPCQQHRQLQFVRRNPRRSPRLDRRASRHRQLHSIWRRRHR